jgi:CelD/BcsL family acetyltransferase involved in cellulose biosynthesis
MSSISTRIQSTNLFGFESQLVSRRKPAAERLRVVELDLDDPRLIPFVSAHPSGTVYHHPAWLRALCAEYNHDIVLLGCENQCGHLVGVMPLMQTRGVPLSLFGGQAQARISSLPRTPVAGPLCVTPEATRLLLMAAIDRASRQRGVRLQVKTEGPLLDGFADGFTGLPWRKSFVLTLPENPAELLLGRSGARRKHIRASIKRAQNLGVRVRDANSEEDLRTWYGIYLRTMRRVVVPPRSLRWFQAMWKFMHPLGLMKVTLAERRSEGKTEIVAGSIFLMHGRKIFYAFSACPAECFHLQANDLIHWETIHWAANAGFREYDFGEVPDDAVQLAAYKAKWGAQERILYRYYSPQIGAENPHSSMLSGRRRLLEKVWRKLPLHVTARLGDLIYSYL